MNQYTIAVGVVITVLLSWLLYNYISAPQPAEAFAPYLSTLAHDNPISQASHDTPRSNPPPLNSEDMLFEQAVGVALHEADIDPRIPARYSQDMLAYPKKYHIGLQV